MPPPPPFCMLIMFSCSAPDFPRWSRHTLNTALPSRDYQAFACLPVSVLYLRSPGN